MARSPRVDRVPAKGAPTGCILGASAAIGHVRRRAMGRITVVNDNPEFLELVSEILESDRYEATAIDGDRPDAIERIHASDPDLLMIDVRLGSDELHGWEVAQRVRRDPRFTHLPILLCSADIPALTELEEDLAADRRVRTLPKPFSIDELTELVDEMLADRSGH
jgi:CheY-like chemotaxis protein